MPKPEREGLLKEPIPLRPAGDTVGSMFEQSEAHSVKNGAQFNGGDICLNNRATLQARVVIAYRGSNHGLHSKRLVKYAKNGGEIPFKNMRARHAIDVSHDSNISFAEEYIINLSASRSMLQSAIKPSGAKI